MTTGRINQVLSEDATTICRAINWRLKRSSILVNSRLQTQPKARNRYRMMDESIKTHPASCALASQTALLFQSISWLQTAESSKRNRCEYRVRQAYKYRSPLSFARIASNSLVFLHFCLCRLLDRSPPGQPTTKLAATNTSQL